MRIIHLLNQIKSLAKALCIKNNCSVFFFLNTVFTFFNIFFFFATFHTLLPICIHSIANYTSLFQFSFLIVAMLAHAYAMCVVTPIHCLKQLSMWQGDNTGEELEEVVIP